MEKKKKVEKSPIFCAASGSGGDDDVVPFFSKAADSFDGIIKKEATTWESLWE